MRKIIVIGTVLFLSLNLRAQEKMLLYSHYTFNGLAINPAFAGSNEALSVNISHRSQWIGFEGAPSYNIVSFHSPYKNTPMGFGLLVINESMGLRKFTGAYVNYAHRIKVGNGKLCLGLKGGVGAGKTDPVDLGEDVVFSENAKRYILPNFGLGVYYYTRKYYLGLSVPLLLGYKSNASGDVVAYHDFNKYAYYLTAGTRLSLCADWKVEPSLFMEYDRASKLIFDGGASLLYKDILRAGLNYRVKQALILLIDYKINYQMHVGLAYDYGLGGISEYSRSSVEVALQYNFGYRVKASNPTVF
jgi:type IX secretion system PorP/SprF family membrane protein